jgi:hypothetical protein
MKALVAVVLLFAVVIGCVVMASVKFGENESQRVAQSAPAVQPVPTAPPPAQAQSIPPAQPEAVKSPHPEPVTPEEPEDVTPDETEAETPAQPEPVRVVYVPQVIERVYVKEVVREVRVEQPIERPPSPPQVSVPNYPPVRWKAESDPSFNSAEEAGSRCYRYVPCAANRFNQYRGAPTFYPRLTHFYFRGGRRWNGR